MKQFINIINKTCCFFPAFPLEKLHIPSELGSVFVSRPLYLTDGPRVQSQVS